MKILLAHVYFLNEDPVEQNVMRPYPPLGLLYVSGYLQSMGIGHEVFDGTFASFEDLKNYLKQEKPDLIAFYANFLTRVNVVKTIDFIRQNPELAGMIIVLGGPDVRYHQQEYLDSGAGFLVLGEGEVTFYELLEGLQQGFDMQQIAGLVYTDSNGVKVNTGERTYLKYPDSLPWPNRSKIDLQKYLDTWQDNHGYSSVTINTQRGCPYTCRWCSHAVFGDTYRRRSPGSVVEEIEFLQKKYNPGSFWFVDDVFTMSEKWLREFEEELNKREVRISYECITRADRLNERILLSLKNSGCRLVWIGAESGSQRVIDLMDRRVNVGWVRKMIVKARELGIGTGTFIMLGYPGETAADIRENLVHLKYCRPDYFTINIAYPIKGTKLYTEVAGEITTNDGWPGPIDRDVDFQRPYSRKFYNLAIRQISNEVYFRRNMAKGDWFAAIENKAKALMASVGMALSK